MSYGNLFWGNKDVPNHSQWRIKAEKMLAGSNLWTPTADKKYPVGAIAESRDGWRWRYCENGAVALAKNRVVTQKTENAANQDTLQTAYGTAAGTKKFDVLVGTGGGISDHDLIDGYLLVNQGTGVTDEGDMYVIKDNKWVTGDTVMSIEIADAGGVRNVIAATSNITLVENIRRDVVVMPTTLVGKAIGICQTIVPIGYYFWAQTRGVASCLWDDSDTILIGDPVGSVASGSGTTGAVGLVAAIATDPILGYVVSVPVTAGADYGLVDLIIE